MHLRGLHCGNNTVGGWFSHCSLPPHAVMPANVASFCLAISSFGSPSVLPGSGGCLPRAPAGRASKPLPKCFSRRDCSTIRMEVITQVPDAGHDQQRNRLVQSGCDCGGGELQFQRERHGVDQRSGLQHADELVAGRRNDDAHGLRKHHTTHDHGTLHAQCLGRFGLARIDSFKTRTHDFSQICRFVQCETQPCRVKRGNDGLRVNAPEFNGSERNTHADARHPTRRTDPQNTSCVYTGVPRKNQM